MKLQLTPDWLIGPRNALRTAILYVAIVSILLAVGYVAIGSGAIGAGDLDEIDNESIEVTNSTGTIYADVTANDSIEDHGVVDPANYNVNLSGTTLEFTTAPNAQREYAVDLNSTDETIRVPGSKITDDSGDGTYTIDLSGESENVTTDDSIDEIEAIAVALVHVEDSEGTITNETTLDLTVGEQVSAEFATETDDGNQTIATGNYTVTVYGDAATIAETSIGTTETSGGVVGAAKDNAVVLGALAIFAISLIAGVILARDEQ